METHMATTSKSPITVADYLSKQIEVCGRTQLEISKICEFKRPQMISMMKSGAVRVPLDKVRLLAKALNVDPHYFFRIVMTEYMPQLIEFMDDASKQPSLTKNELEIVMAIRSANSNNPRLTSVAHRAKLTALFTSMPGDTE
jgi:hypothetical protein